MIEGVVTAGYEAVITLPLQDPAGRTREVEAVVDTGFNGYLTLPPVLVADLGLPVVGDGEAVLADGSEAAFDVYGVTVVWDGEPRYVETGAVGVDPLVGMSLLDSYSLYVEVADGGRVVIEPARSP
ncbi:MAG: clan AA aspartic protease [Chloroflexi bacterium]|nr:clan AA aspartic protease [Chloroflexota bacterium]